MSNVFNNQITANIYGHTSVVKKAIVKQLATKSPEQQEEIIGTLLQLLDVNILASLYMAYMAAGDTCVKEE